MAAESNSPRNLRKKVRKNYSEVVIDDYFSSSTSSYEVKKRTPKNKNFHGSITDFDCCCLTENKTWSFCEPCSQSKQENMTRFCCLTCNITCCLNCYDVHHKERMLESLRSFCVNCAADDEILISDAGEMSTVLNNDNIEHDEVVFDVRKKSNSAVKSTLTKMLSSLQREFEKTGVEFYSNETLDCIFFQDKQMKDFFSYYPEFISVDVPCEIVELEYILYLFISEDSNGNCEIISASLLKSDDRYTLKWLCDIFKKNNPKWKKTKIILVDKQIQNFEILQSGFSSSTLLVSSFHATQSFKTALSNLGIDKTAKVSALKVFDNMINSTSESEYARLYNEMKQISSEIILYFEQNWHSKNTWRIASKFTSNSFLEPMNKFLGSIEKKMKSTLNTKKCLESFFRSFFMIILNFRKDKFETLSTVFQMMTVTTHSKTPQYKYAKSLTQYAGKIVVCQLNLASEVKNIQKLSVGKYIVSYQSTTVNVGTTSCSCDFYKTLSLPCCHIFAVRKFLSLPMFLETMCSTRWIARCYQNIFVILHALFMRQNYLESGYKHYIESNFQKYFDMCGQLLPLISNGANQRAVVLGLLLDAWKYDIKVNVKVSENFNSKNREIEFDCSIDDLKDLYGVAVNEHSDSDDDFSSVSLCSPNSADDLLKGITDDPTFNETNN